MVDGSLPVPWAAIKRLVMQMIRKRKRPQMLPVVPLVVEVVVLVGVTTSQMDPNQALVHRPRHSPAPPSIKPIALCHS